jgi:phenylacetic acid degradation operon negative regulatory protein
MAHEDGTILAKELYPVATACGQSADQVRSCLRRLVTEGLFVRHGSGAAARFNATEAGLAELGGSLERHRLAYTQDSAGRGWDRLWRLVAFAVPEDRRADRDGFRDRLIAFGGAAIQGGLYVSPQPSWHKDARAEAERLDLVPLVSFATTDDLDTGGERDPRLLAQHLWHLDQLAERYRSFVADYQGVLDYLQGLRQRRQRLSDAEFLPGALGMAVAFQACFADDPLLPPELLPRPWPGREARDLTMRCRRLALTLRQVQGRPPLFRLFDEATQVVP